MPKNSQTVHHECLGCAESVGAEFYWHDGLYRSYYCRDHVRDMLPRERAEDRDSVVSGYAIKTETGEKYVVKDDLK